MPVPAALLEHERLLAQLERARGLGFLGPGPVEAHIEHTAGFLDAIERVTGTVVDLGSGGGVPGLIIGVARPDLDVLLLDATASRCRFLEHAVRELDLAATVVEGRAEAVGHGSRPRVRRRRRGPQLRPTRRHGRVRRSPAGRRRTPGGQRAPGARR